MSESQKYEVLDLNTRITCKTRIALKGDTFSANEALAPSILEDLVTVGKLKKITDKKKSVVKSTPSSNTKTATSNTKTSTSNSKGSEAKKD